MAKAKLSGTSARFRQRKISVKQTLAILRHSDVPDLEDEQQRELQQVETGVEKGEEDEHHLQAAINASLAQSSGQQVEQIFIPTPDASKAWPEYDKFYQNNFSDPASYIRTSATVEETTGCPYNMDEIDEEFLKQLREKLPTPCTEDEFEQIMYRFESTIDIKQPFLSMDASQILSYQEIADYVIKTVQDAENDPSSPDFILSLSNQPGPSSSLYKTALKRNTKKSLLSTFKQFGEIIYPHWKQRRQQRGGHSIFPRLKFEDNEKDDSDPYVCFRHRELRQVRKTRRTDTNSSEKLRRLLVEMHTAKQLVEMVAKREFTRREALQIEWDIFEHRAKVKELKRVLGIKDEDDDLVAHKKKKPNTNAHNSADPSTAQGASANISATSSSKANVNNLVNNSKRSKDGSNTGSASSSAGSRAGVLNGITSTGAGAGISSSSSGLGSSNNHLHQSGGSAGGSLLIDGSNSSNTAGSGGSNRNINPLAQVPANVRLPASKIPDMELLSIEQVQTDKDKAIKKLVDEKLRSRANMDTEWCNLTDNAYIPFVSYFKDKESNDAKRNDSNSYDLGMDIDNFEILSGLNDFEPLLDTTDNFLESSKPRFCEKPRSESKLHRYQPPAGFNRGHEITDSSANLLKLPLSYDNVFSLNHPQNKATIIKASVSTDGELKVLSHISQDQLTTKDQCAVPHKRSSVLLRRRIGRGGRVMIDRRPSPRYRRDLINRLPDLMDVNDNNMTLGHNSPIDIDNERAIDIDGSESEGNEDDYVINDKERYMEQKLLADRWKFDDDSRYDKPMKFNDGTPGEIIGISSETQSLRFSSMLLSKAYDNYREAYQQRQQQLIMFQQQLLQKQLQQQQAHAHASHLTSNVQGGNTGPNGANSSQAGSNGTTSQQRSSMSPAPNSLRSGNICSNNNKSSNNNNSGTSMSNGASNNGVPGQGGVNKSLVMTNQALLAQQKLLQTTSKNRGVNNNSSNNITHGVNENNVNNTNITNALGNNIAMGSNNLSNNNNININNDSNRGTNLNANGSNPTYKKPNVMPNFLSGVTGVANAKSISHSNNSPANTNSALVGITGSGIIGGTLKPQPTPQQLLSAQQRLAAQQQAHVQATKASILLQQQQQNKLQYQLQHQNQKQQNKIQYQLQHQQQQQQNKLQQQQLQQQLQKQQLQQLHQLQQLQQLQQQQQQQQQRQPQSQPLPQSLLPPSQQPTSSRQTQSPPAGNDRLNPSAGFGGSVAAPSAPGNIGDVGRVVSSNNSESYNTNVRSLASSPDLTPLLSNKAAYKPKGSSPSPALLARTNGNTSSFTGINPSIGSAVVSDDTKLITDSPSGAKNNDNLSNTGDTSSNAADSNTILNQTGVLSTPSSTLLPSPVLSSKTNNVTNFKNIPVTSSETEVAASSASLTPKPATDPEAKNSTVAVNLAAAIVEG